MMYAEYVIGDLKNRGSVYPVGEFKLNGQRRECYRSLFVYGPELKEWVDKSGTVRGFNGPHTAEQFVVDVDYEGDLEKAKDETERIVGRLAVMYDVPVSHIRIAFSGSKGFHIAIPIQCFTDNPKPQYDFYKVFLGIAHDLCDGFEGVDFKIYESKRIFRMSNTINGKTGLYKIPLTVDEFRTLSVLEIKELAKTERKVYYLPIEELSVVPALAELYEKHSAEKHEPEPVKQNDDILSGLNTGGRNDALTKLIGLFISKGFDEPYTLEFMRMWNERNAPPLPSHELEETVSKLYRSYGGTKTLELLDLRQAGYNYLEFIKRMKGAKVKLGIPELDELTRGICPGEVAYILGRTGVGKSALLQWCGRNYAMEAVEPTVMLSLEMPSSMVFERNFQMERGMSGFAVETYFDSPGIEKEIQEIYEANPSFYIADQPGLTLEDVKSYIRHGEMNVYKKKTGLVLVDYLGLVRDRGKDTYEIMSRIARELKNVAKEMDVPIVALVQVSRKYSETQPLELEAARDSGSIEEAADFVMGVWRDENQAKCNMKNEYINMNLSLLKNRKGARGQWPIQMSRIGLNFRLMPEKDDTMPPPLITGVYDEEEAKF